MCTSTLLIVPLDIVVGGGSAGCTLAARIAEDDDVSVLLLEAGGDEDLMVQTYLRLVFSVSFLTMRYRMSQCPSNTMIYN